MDDDEDYYQDYDQDDSCDHDPYDVDILTGRAHCYRCGEAWWLSSDQLKAELELHARMCEECDDDRAT